MRTKSSSAQIDASFYQLIHQVAGTALRQEKRSDRRGRRRYRFWTRQLVAPWDGGPVPPDEEFGCVQCYDLTQAGFSFFLPAEPAYASLAVAFGQAPNMIFVGAEVVHCARVLLHASGLVEEIEERASHVSYQSPDGRPATPLVMVGCRFVRRLERTGVAEGGE
jgi:hypothetical protein